MSGDVSLSADALAALMPMHVLVGPTGRIRATGPTLARLCGGRPIVGERLLEVFEFRRPAAPSGMADLVARAGRRLSLRLRGGRGTAFKGHLVPLSGRQGVLLNLSFGIGAVGAVTEHRLSADDFAPTDLTVEMLYLVEAKSMAMEESRRLNARLERARSAAEEQALTDPLTGLRNRRAMEETLGRLLAARVPFGLIHLDLDHFKQVNDTLGHAAGDAVLGAVARALRADLRGGDLAARLGGDEFVLVLPEMTDTNRLVAVAQRVIARIEEPVAFGAEECRVSASAGVAVSTGRGPDNAETILQVADAALYASKHAGRGCVTVHSGSGGSDMDAA